MSRSFLDLLESFVHRCVLSLLSLSPDVVEEFLLDVFRFRCNRQQ